ncbi:MAG: FliM/FliN family flagellar motor switch protein [Planctomycetaceae bacterium]|nr:FliM/FliN family flagellar motor switch protein [Planctomycetaceae bacterium]
MSDLNATASDSFLRAIAGGAGEAASAFSRTFDAQVAFTAGTGGPLDLATLQSGFSVPGLVMSLLAEGQTILVLIPANTGLIPDWCKVPDATGKSKLSTFAQELGMNISPDDFFPEDFQAEMVDNLAEAAKNGKFGPDPGFAELIIDHKGKKTTALVVWPIENQQAVFATKTASTAAEPAAASLSSSLGGFASFPAPQDFSAGSEFEDQLRLSVDELSGFSKSVLKIRVPVAAVLARSRKPIRTILELGIGSVVQFDKSCDEPLELELDRTIIALGEAVKVGDKFGIRLSSVILPKERFRPVEVRKGGEYTRKPPRPAQIIGKAPIRSLER